MKIGIQVNSSLDPGLRRGDMQNKTMSNKKIIQNIRGTRDLYPVDMRKRRWFIEASRKVLEGYGYEEYDAPLLESMELYVAKSSPEIVERQAYVFEDRGGDRVVLRPEMTPSLARMVAAKQRELPSLLRWYSLPECWRYERPQKGRTRNFLQLNVDLLGSDALEADIEIIESALKLLEAYGVDMSKIEVRVNDRTILKQVLLQAGGISEEQEKGLLRLLDERDKLSTEEFAEKWKGLGVSEAIREAVFGLLNSDSKAMGESRIATIVEALVRRRWTQVRFDPTLMRGFEYYTSTVFEVFDTSGKLNRSIFGGGRYDKLIESMGGLSMSAVGYAVSDVAIATLLQDQGKDLREPERAVVAALPFSQAEARAAGEIAMTLREAGKQVTLALPPYDMKKQLKRAAQEGVSKVVLIMPEELARDEVVVKDMQKGEQEIVKISELNKLLVSGSSR